MLIKKYFSIFFLSISIFIINKYFSFFNININKKIKIEKKNI